MSRTIRRKNLTYGSRYWDSFFFTEYDENNNRVNIDKEKEPKKWKKAWHFCHGESGHANERSAGKWIRRFREKQFRGHVQRALKRAVVEDGYEVSIHRHGARNWWDWS